MNVRVETDMGILGGSWTWPLVSPGPVSGPLHRVGTVVTMQSGGILPKSLCNLGT